MKTILFLFLLLSLPASAEVADMVAGAESLRAQGFHEKAIAELKAALDQSDDPALRCRIMSDLGDLYQSAGFPLAARRYLDSALSLAKNLKRADLVAAAENDLGNLEFADGKNASALAHYQSASRLSREAKNSSLEIQALINAARAGDLTVLSRAAILVEALPDGNEKAFYLLAIGELTSDPNSAYEFLEKARKIAVAFGDRRSESYALGFLGRLYQNRPEEALELTRRAIFLAEQLDAPEILYRWYWQKGRLLKSQGKIDDAIAAYRQAVSSLQLVKNDLSGRYGAGQSSFRKVFSPLFFELADLLLERAHSANEKDVAALLEEARSTVEKSKTAELQDYFQDDCVTALQSKIVEIGSFGEHTAIVYPILLQNRIELLVTFPSGIREFSTQVSAEEITGEIRKFRGLLEKRTTRQYLPHAQKLYGWLVSPFARELETQKIDTLVFVPDGPLRTIPMSALHDGKKFLVERYAVATTPGLTLTDPHPLQKKAVRVLLNGLTEAVQGFSALPNVGRELQAIQSDYRNATVLKDENFELKNVEEKLDDAPYSVVHIASHGQFKAEADKTFVLTHDGKLTLDQLEKLIAPTRFSAEPIELLTLSACQTAAGDDRAALGLAGVAIKAGARSALASLWFINDSSSSELVAKFYQYLKNETKAKALQQAQIDLIHDGRFSHPGYWAPFLLIGNWL